MIYLKTPEQLELMRKAADLLSRTFGEIAKWAVPGTTTRKIDTVAREYMQDHGGIPACLGYGGFPGTVCCEVNEIVVHGFPSQYELRDGDIFGADSVVSLEGFCADMCYTFPIGEVEPKTMELLRTTKESLYKGIEACRPGHRIGDIANAVQTYCEHRGYSVVREMCGHGIGVNMHEEPEVPNYGRRGIGPVIRNGMVICIEPMINLGSRNVVIERDGWTCRTRDRKPSAHYEHTVAIHDDMTEVLTTFDFIAEVMGSRFV